MQSKSRQPQAKLSGAQNATKQAQGLKEQGTKQAQGLKEQGTKQAQGVKEQGTKQAQAMKEQGQNAAKEQGKKDPGFTDEDRHEEASKNASKAQAAQKKASELSKAAAGAGDAKERQKLMNEALQNEIEAESFGKTAKWLSSGTFQGFLAGSGIGAVPGVTLGTLTGTLVGGLTTIITGTLGGALGATVGAVNGPFFKLGHVAGNAIGSIMPNLPSWAASDEQKRALEKMLGQINDQDQPSAEELDAITNKTRSSGKQQKRGQSSQANAKQLMDGAQSSLQAGRAYTSGTSKDPSSKSSTAGDKVQGKARVEKPTASPAKGKSDGGQSRDTAAKAGKEKTGKPPRKLEVRKQT